MTTYEEVCNGCEKEMEIRVDGYIGVIEGVWCEECGYEGVNISSEPVQEEPLLEWHEVRLAYEKMDPATPGREALGMILQHKGNNDEDEPSMVGWLCAANNILKSIIGGRWE